MYIKNTVESRPPFFRDELGRGNNSFFSSMDHTKVTILSDLAESADFQNQDGDLGPTLFLIYTYSTLRISFSPVPNANMRHK